MIRSSRLSALWGGNGLMVRPVPSRWVWAACGIRAPKVPVFQPAFWEAGFVYPYGGGHILPSPQLSSGLLPQLSLGLQPFSVTLLTQPPCPDLVPLNSPPSLETSSCTPSIPSLPSLVTVLGPEALLSPLHMTEGAPRKTPILKYQVLLALLSTSPQTSFLT